MTRDKRTDHAEVTKGKRKAGAPRTKTPEVIPDTPEGVTKAVLEQIDELAEAQAKDTMIAEVIGWDVNTFKRQFEQRCREKRAIGKGKVLRAQYRGCFKGGKGAVTERVWFGKQHLEQTDKADQNVKVSAKLDIVVFGSKEAQNAAAPE